MVSATNNGDMQALLNRINSSPNKLKILICYTSDNLLSPIPTTMSTAASNGTSWRAADICSFYPISCPNALAKEVQSYGSRQEMD
jgi:hypothetical protein